MIERPLRVVSGRYNRSAVGQERTSLGENMTSLLHEVWEEPDEDGRMLESLFLAGPDGDEARALLGKDARLVTTFDASSHVEAMTKYYALYQRGEYVTDNPADHDLYPLEWQIRQRKSHS